MRPHYLIAAALLATSLPALSSAQQRPMTRPDSAETLPLCRNAEPGQRCRTRNGEIRTRPGNAEPDNLGGADPGWGVRQEPRTNNLGGGDPGWDVQPAEPRAEGFTGEETVFPAAPEGDQFGGEDPGWAGRVQPGRNQFGGEDAGWVRSPDNRLVRPVGGGTAPESTAMECELCDDDEDIPQGPIDNTPRPDDPAPQEPEGEEEDCEWRNPSQGPDQEFCDE